MESNQFQNNPNDPRTWGALLHPADIQRLSWQQPDTTQPFQPLPNPLHTAPMPSGPGMPLSDAFPFAGKAAAGDLILNVLLIGVLWEVWVCLYPLAALAGLLTLTNGIPLLVRVVPGFYAVVLGIAAAAFVLWKVSRVEHVLARSGAYRLARHFVRVPLLGLATVAAIQTAEGFPYNLTPAAILRVLKAPTNLALVLGAMVASHFILWNWTWARRFWHARLAAARLR